MRPAFIALPLALLLAACAETTPTLTPTRALSGPTIQPSATFAAPRPADAPQDTLFIGQNNPTAAALAPGAVMPPLVVSPAALAGPRQTVEIPAEDGALLLGDFYAGDDRLSPGLLLLAADTSGWGDFPAKLHAAGFTVLVMGVRPASALADFRVFLQALINSDADPARVGVVGAGVGADVALRGCAADMICDAVALLSPSNDPALASAMPQVNPRPLFLAASEEDTEAFAAISALRAAATGEVLFQPLARAGAGTALLQNRPDVGDLLLAWLEIKII